MMTTLKNSDGEVYFFQCEVKNPKDAEKSLIGFWEAVNPGLLESVRDTILMEVTDRGQCVRSRYAEPLLTIYTHGWTKEDDTMALPLTALEFLMSNFDLEKP
jgi:hypothetical protein